LYPNQLNYNRKIKPNIVLQVETWRPRVQGVQLKALAGARLPESEPEFAAISRVVSSLQDCLKPESSAELFMQELRITISQIQAWWENRNRRPDGELKSLQRERILDLVLAAADSVSLALKLMAAPWYSFILLRKRAAQELMWGCTQLGLLRPKQATAA
jgi:hypothetical protein